MGIASARAYANNEVAYLAWRLDAAIPGCLGFQITRIYGDGERRILAAWVPFVGQSNPDWKPQDTSVWPIQKLTWRDLTARKRRDQETLRPADIEVTYEVRPVGDAAPGLEPVPLDPTLPGYTGAPRPLAYLGPPVLTNKVRITADRGDGLHATFTNGILAAQWLTHVLPRSPNTGGPDLAVLKKRIATPRDPLRGYLSGDVLALLKALLERAGRDGGHVHLALYELDDDELIDLILANKTKVRLILSNTGATKPKKPKGAVGPAPKPVWDNENAPARAKLKAAGVDIQDRMFNNTAIGHNKFAVYLDKTGAPRAVLTGSTNWTPNGLCAQTNNALLVESDAVAQAYLGYWTNLHTDVLPSPNPLSAGTRNVQGQALRKADAIAKAIPTATGEVTPWFSPNTVKATKNSASPTPPDLASLYALMRQAKHAIFFLAFLPGMQGRQSIIEEAIKIGDEHPDLLVMGAISSPMAMPGGHDQGDEESDGAVYKSGAQSDEDGPSPTVFDSSSVQIVRAFNITKDDLIGDFQQELLSAGNAIIHDKIVVIDPLSDDCVVALGSHNLGFKASYSNDENMLIFRGHKSLAEAYAVHVLDVYDHYRFRATQWDRVSKGQPGEDGFLSVTDAWQQKYVHPAAASESAYFG